MRNFVNDLKVFGTTAAKKLREDVKTGDKTIRYREMRQEAQVVAEVYHMLRKSGYDIDGLFLEYVYGTPVENGNNKQKLKPDMIYSHNGVAEVAEFRVFWDGDLYKRNPSAINGTAQNIITEYWKKLLAYSKLPNAISSCSLVVCYLGPNFLENSKEFSMAKFSSSVSSCLGLDKESQEMDRIQYNAIVC